MLPEPSTACTIVPPSLDHFTFSVDRIATEQFDSSIFRNRHEEKVSMKRPRATADVDGDGSGDLQKKKRRLRLDLITSRLSQPYATPTTYIVSRESKRAARLVRPRSGARTLLRRAASINWMRRRRGQVQGTGHASTHKHQAEVHPRRDGTASLKVESKSVTPLGDQVHSITRTSTPSSPSLLGVSNYDAIDSEGDPYDDDVWCESPTEFLNSDFSKRDPIEPAVVDLETFPTLHLDSTSMDSDGSYGKDIMELVTDEEKQHEISFAQFT